MKNVIFVNNINFKEIRAFKAHEVFFICSPFLSLCFRRRIFTDGLLESP